jgi:hypothetical protein
MRNDGLYSAEIAGLSKLEAIVLYINVASSPKKALPASLAILRMNRVLVNQDGIGVRLRNAIAPHDPGARLFANTPRAGAVAAGHRRMTERPLQEGREGLARHLARPHGELAMPD